ncbi:MAG TPA: DegT/DnrJ/EryC1/StrS family aminotransferase [bacterium]|nr:DegT/DnrJ/EryC1/StrS family aminotransferase [bacterium]
MREELALFGGEKTARDPFPPWPQFAQKTLEEALEPLRTGRVGAWPGGRGRELEKQWAAWVGSRHAVCCSSGTAALHVGLLAVGAAGGQVILPSHTFASTALAVVHAGAEPVFCDVAEDGTLDPRKVEPLLTPRTRAIIAVHLHGTVCAMDRLMEIAQRGGGVRVVEDCAQCVGGELKGKKAGTLGHVGCFSFSQGKHVSAGEGGMIVCDDDQTARSSRSLCDYGRDPDETDAETAARHVNAGFNYRMTEVQAAIALSELERVDTWNLPRRRGYAKIYDHAFSQAYGVRSLPFNSPERRNAYWKYPLQLDLAKLACGGEEFLRALAAEGIPECRALPPEAYAEPALQGWAREKCQTAEALRERTVLLGVSPTWEKSHIETCITAVKKLLKAYRR